MTHTETSTTSHTGTTHDRLTENQLRDLVDQLAAVAGVVRLQVAFLPWLDDPAAVVNTAYRPGRRAEPARIDVDRTALDELSPTAWRHLLTHEIGHLKLHHTRTTAMVQDTLDVIGSAFGLAAIAWFILRDQSITILVAGLSIMVVAAIARYGWNLRCELQADWYVAQVAGLEHSTIDEVWAYLEQRAAMTLGERYRCHKLQQLADTVTPALTQIDAATPSTELRHRIDGGGVS